MLAPFKFTVLEKELAEKECLNVGEQGAQAFIAIYSFANYTISCLVTRITFAHKLSYELRKTQRKLIPRLCADSGGYVMLGSRSSQLHFVPVWDHRLHKSATQSCT